MSDWIDVTGEEGAKWLAEQGEPTFRRRQIADWIYEKFAISWDEMTNLKESLKKKLSIQYSYPMLSLEKVEHSEDGQTQKFLFSLLQGDLVESVLISSGRRRTLCLSSQIGCRARCAFCASGAAGWKRNLCTAEIVEQWIQVNCWLQSKGERISHLVFMGMGEPLENLVAVRKSIELFTHPDCGSLSTRRITLSTVGLVEEIYELAKQKPSISLAFSLHAPNQEIRKKIIPYARKYPLDKILHALDHYSSLTGREVTYEYVLIDKINAEREHALQLAKLIANRSVTLNLIPYNPIPVRSLRRPSTEKIRAFIYTLRQRGVRRVTCRYTKGVDIAAACGQLALQENVSFSTPSEKHRANRGREEREKRDEREGDVQRSLSREAIENQRARVDL